MDLTSIPRVQLAHLPTPLEPLETLSRHLDGPDIYVKRDDCTGLAGGGNKTRKLEFLMADALEQGADTIVTAGATQSNHVRQSIAAAAKMGMHAEVLLEVRTIRDDDYAGNGNIILDNLMGAKIHYCDPVDDLNADCQALADKLAGEGAKPYFIPVGGSNKIGALGYADCASEIIGQSAEMGLAVDGIVVASGSQGTQGWEQPGTPHHTRNNQVGFRHCRNRNSTFRTGKDFHIQIANPFFQCIQFSGIKQGY